MGETLQRLSTCSSEAAAYRHQRDQARAERDEALAALADVLAIVERLAIGDETPDEVRAEIAARLLVERYPSARSLAQDRSTITP